MDEDRLTSREPRAGGSGLVKLRFEWQLEAIRAALRAHKAYARMLDDKPLSWEGIAIAIDEYTGIPVDGEGLRQFVEGVSKKKAPIRYRKLSNEHMQAIVSYLCDPLIEALSRDELEENTPVYQAGLHLLRYLKQELDEGTIKPPAKLRGSYLREARFDSLVSEHKIVFDIQPDSEIILVKEIERIFADSANAGSVRSWNEKLRSRLLKATIESRGWAIVTPEDNILVFMKQEPYARNHYWSLMTECDMWSDASINRLILLKKDYPMEVPVDSPDVNANLEAIWTHLETRIYFFDRT